jgi:hypothetical protein
MIKWMGKTLGLFLLSIMLVYVFVYIPDYFNYEEWHPEFTDLNGSPLAHPCNVSEKLFVFLMWTQPNCPYCGQQLEAFYLFMEDQGVSEEYFDIILVYAEVPEELPEDMIVILGDPKIATPYTEFWVNQDGMWTKFVEWQGYRDVAGMNQLFTEASNESES